MQKFIPKTLVMRLVAVIATALVLAMVSVALINQAQRDNLFQQLIEDQALAQTAGLANFLRNTDISNLEQSLKTYNSESTCASLETPPENLSRRQAYQPQLSTKLDKLITTANEKASVVFTERLRPGTTSCQTKFETMREVGHHHRPFGRAVLVNSYVPLQNGKWLYLKTVVEFPEQSNLAIALPLLLAALGVAGTALWFARGQTKTLRQLADAAERFGRGENVAELPETGPREVVSAARAFNIMQERQRTFLNDRLKMLASMGHDLRTPLTALRLKAEFVKDKLARQDLINSIDEMTTITEASLAFTKAEASNEPTQATDMTALLKELCAEQKGKALCETTGSIILDCRPVALKRALRNVIENAVRYGDEAAVSITKTGGDISIAIEDKGPGVPPDMFDEVFKPFTRLEASRNKNTGGIGMGLAISRSIIQAHGGTLSLSNREPQGLRVEIALPFAPSTQL